MAVLFSDTFPAASGSWDTAKWPTTYAETGTSTSQASGVGRFNMPATFVNLRVHAANPGADRGLKFRQRFPNGAADGVLRVLLRSDGVNITSSSDQSRTNNCYALDINRTATTVGLDKIVNGTRTGLGDVTVTAQNTAWMWWRFEVVGTTVRWKRWADGATEPTTWARSVTDTSLTSGSAALTSGFLATDDVEFTNVEYYDFVSTIPVQPGSAVSPRGAGPITATLSVRPGPAISDRGAGPVAIGVPQLRVEPASAVSGRAAGDVTVTVGPPPIETTLDPARARIGVQLRYFPGTPTTVYRVVDGHRSPVRAAQAVVPIGGQWFGWDDEAPLGRPVTYTAMSGTVERVCAPVVLRATRRTWLKAPSLPALNMPIYRQTVPDLDHDIPRTVHRPLGRPDPVVVSLRRQYFSGSVTLFTFTEAEAAQLLQLLRSAPVVLLQNDQARWGDRYLSVGKVTEARAGRLLDSHETRWQLEVDEVRAPAGAALGAVASLQLLLEEGGTLRQLRDSGGTLLDLLRGS